VLAAIIDFKTVLQFAVAQVEFSAFVASPTLTMASTEACNQVPGAKNFDYLLATVTSALAFAVVLPTIYEVAKVCCPYDPEAMQKADKLQEKGQHEAEAQVIISKQKQKSRPAPLNFWSYLRMPLTLFAPDLLLAHFTYGLVWLLKNSINANREDKDRDKEACSASAGVISKTDNPMHGHPPSISPDKFTYKERVKSRRSLPQQCMASMRSYYAYMLRTLYPFQPESAEAERLRLTTKKNLLPSYWDLLRYEAHELFGLPEPTPDDPNEKTSLLSGAAACLLAVVPVGHVLTHNGRNAAVEVGSRFGYFFLALFGRWNKDVVAAYDIIGQVERMAVDSIEENSQDRNRANLRYSQVIEATIAPRAILLQLVPWLTIWSIFSIATSRSAMWAPLESGLRGEVKRTKKKKTKKGTAEQEDDAVKSATDDPAEEDGEAKVFPWLISFNDAFERAKHEDNGRWKKRRWITYISALRIIVLYSRAIQYLVSSYMNFVSVWVLFNPANKAVLASIVIVLLPLAIVQGLGVVLVIGKALNVKDLLDVGRKGNKENKATEFMLKGKSEQEKKENKMKVRDLLTKEHSESLRVIRPLTDAEDEDDFDFDSWGPSSENEESRLDVEMTTTHRHRAHQSVAEAILPARISIIPRDSIGPEMAPSRLSYDGVVDPHRPSILALSSHHHHVLQAHGHLNALHQQQQQHSPDQADRAPSRPVSTAASAEVPAGQRLHIQRPSHGDSATTTSTPPPRLSFDGREPPQRPSVLAPRPYSNQHQHQHVALCHEQHSSPDLNPNPNPNPGFGSGSGRQGQGQHIRIQRGQSTQGTTSPLAALRFAAPPAAPQGSPLQSFSRLPSGSVDPAQVAATVRVASHAPVPVSSWASSRDNDAGATPPAHRLKFSGAKDKPHSHGHG